jgi:hypothetical protein
MARAKWSDRALAGGVPAPLSGAERFAFKLRWSGFRAAAVGVSRVRVEKADDLTDSTIDAVAHIVRRDVAKIDDGDAWLLVLGESK